MLNSPDIFPLLVLLLGTSTVRSLTVSIHPDNAFSLGPLSYRSLVLNQRLSSLYVGSRDNIFRLWLYNINDTSATLYSHRELKVRTEEREECLRLGNTDRECDFWVRQIFMRSDNNLLICASQAMKPQLGLFDGQSLAELEPARTQIGICSQHDGLNTTAVYTENGNPDGLPALYSGIRTGLSLENHLIYRPPLVRDEREIHPALRTSIYDSSWLNEPQFVASHAIGSYVYFFFRETLSADCYNCPSADTGKGTSVSRVARICKSDLGGRQVLRQVWTSFVKARLNCSLAGFSFNQIQSVARVDEPSSNAEGNSAPSSTVDTVFYATFTAAERTPLRASAICAFSLGTINQLFDSGLFLEQSVSGSGSWWNPTPADQMPASRPGACQSDSRQLSDEDLHFAKSHLLMAESVAPLGGAPLLYRRNELLANIVADGPDREGRVVLFAYSPASHSLLKVLHSLRPSNSNSRLPFSSFSDLLAIFRLPPTKKLHSLAILPSEYIYIGTEEQVSQFRLGQCPAYGPNCAQCARDPYCSWSIARRECFPIDPSHSGAVGWIVASPSSSSSTDDVRERCAKYARAVPITVFPGDAVHLECGEIEAENGGEPQIEWRHNGRTVPTFKTTNFVLSRDGGLVLLNVTETMGGEYECKSMGMEEGQQHPAAIAAYSVKVDGEDCARPKSVAQFRSAQREWCRRMDAYRSNLSKWQNIYENGVNGEGGNCRMEKEQQMERQKEEGGGGGGTTANFL